MRGRAATLLVAALGTACGAEGASSGSADTLDGGLDVNSPGVVIAHRANTLVQQNHDAACAVCPTCGGFSPGSDSCEGTLLDAHPEAKPNVLCRIAADGRQRRCLAEAKTCSDATQCESIAKSEYAGCPLVTVTAAPPAGC